MEKEMTRWWIFLLLALNSAHVTASNPEYLVLDEGKFRDYWTAEKHGNGGTPFPVTKLGLGSACIAVAMSIESDGTTANRRVLRMHLGSVGDDVGEQFKQAALKYFGESRFLPTDVNLSRRPVYSYGIFTFERTRADSLASRVKRNNDAANEPCRIPDFVHAVASGKLLDEEN